MYSRSEILEPEIEITEEFLTEHEELLLFCIYALLQAALRTSGRCGFRRVGSRRLAGPYSTDEGIGFGLRILSR